MEPPSDEPNRVPISCSGRNVSTGLTDFSKKRVSGFRPTQSADRNGPRRYRRATVVALDASAA
jgi:hypothetical protein